MTNFPVKHDTLSKVEAATTQTHANLINENRWFFFIFNVRPLSLTPHAKIEEETKISHQVKSSIIISTQNHLDYEQSPI